MSHTHHEPHSYRGDLADSPLSDLEKRMERAEYFMNHALEQRRWNAVQVHRTVMLVVQAECDRRLKAQASERSQLVANQEE